MKIITDRKFLTTPLPTKEMTTDEIDGVSIMLEKELDKYGGVGLAANQLGLEDRICIINVIDKLILVNPKIIEASTQTVAYAEQCFSLPKSMKHPVKTVRFKTIKVETDNLGILEFGPTATPLEPWKTSEDFFSDEGLLECVCVQHEIDHLNGVLMNHSTRKYSATVTSPKKYGRNEKVMVKMPNGDTEFMKYKKAKPMLNLGCEIL